MGADLRSGLFQGVAVAAALLLPATASALIVAGGKVVPRWPDEPADSALGGMQRQVSSESFYPNPKGTVFSLTIIVDFSDMPAEFDVAQVQAWLNEPGYSEDGVNGSIRDYYYEASNGMVEMQTEVAGYYRADQPKSYYEAGANYSRATELVDELLDKADPDVDFSQFDNDGDGRIEALNIVYAGPSEEFAQGLWPHAGSVNSTRDGVQVRRYQMSQMGNRLELYTFAHEAGHMIFGWPDLYGFGNYCIMGNASSPTNPVGINDFYRADQGWIPVIDIDASTNARYLATPNGGGYRYVNPARDGELFFWSNVQAADRWSTLRGSGMVVLHFDYEIRNNDPPNPLSLAVVQADGQRELDETQWPEPGSDDGDFYAAGTNTELSESTNPASEWNNGSASGLRLYEISENGDMMTFAVGTGTPDPTVMGHAGMVGAPGASGAAGALGGGAGGAAPEGGASAAGTAGEVTTAGAGGVVAGGNGGGAAGGLVAVAGQPAASGGVPAGAGSPSSGGSAPVAGSAPTAGGSPGGSPATISGGAPVAGTPGTAGSGAELAAAEDAGCACRQASPGAGGRAWLLATMATLAAAARRRRSTPA